MAETLIPAPNKYVTHFNAVVSNYAEALIVDGQGSERHQRSAQSLDVLMREYALATELLDYVRFTRCFEQIERSKNTGGDYRLLATRLEEAYPPLTQEIRDFVVELEAAHA